MRLHRILGLLPAALLTLAAWGGIGAESFPTRPIHLMVGFSPGGATDVGVRVIASKMAESLGQPFVVDSRPGASTTIAADVVAKSAPDGYTLFVAGNANAVNAVTQARLPFDIQKDFVPVGLAATSPSVLVVGLAQHINTVADLISEAKRRPNQIFFASSGNGAVSHIAAEVFAKATETKLTHVPYKGSSQAILDVIAGRVSIMFAPISTALPFLRSGTLKALAITSPERSSTLPAVPTLAELGFSTSGAAIWFGLVAPRGTPADRVTRLSGALSAALDDEAVKTQLAFQGMIPLKGAAAEFSDKLSSEIALVRELDRSDALAHQ